MSAPGDRATREDPVTGAREVAGWWGAPPMFAVLHLPPEPSVAGLVVCPSLGDEFRRNYRREVVLARSLSAAGVAVVRFQHRGEGSSQGGPSASGFEPMVREAGQAAALLREEAAIDRMAFLGTRWGGLVAAAASRQAGAPLALWDPAVTGRAYVRELFRVSLIRDLSAEDGQPSPERVLEALRRDGFIDVRGHRIDRGLVEGAEGLSLAEEIGDVPRPVLLAHFGRRGLRPAYAELLAGLEARGFPVRTHVIDHDEVWWFLNPRQRVGDDRRASGALVEATSDWVRERLAPSGVG